MFDVVNTIEGDSEPVADGLKGFSGRQMSTDGWNVVVAKFCVAVGLPNSFSKDTRRVEPVLRRGDVFQVLRPVIGLVAVFVIGLLAFGEWSNKGGHNQPMNPVGPSLAVAVQGNKGISVTVAGLANPANDGVSTGCDSLDPSQRRDLVDALVADYCFPDFRGIVALRHDSIPLKSGRVQSWVGVSAPFPARSFLSRQPNLVKENLNG